MKRCQWTFLFVAAICLNSSSPLSAQDATAPSYRPQPTGLPAHYPETPEAFSKYGAEYYKTEYADENYRSQQHDSLTYYGPGGLWYQWNPSQRRGRDMWLFWTGGNQNFYRRLQITLGTRLGLPIDFFRALDSRNRNHRFRDIGFINEPNTSQAARPDRYGLWLDNWDRDPKDYYPNQYYKDPHDLNKYWGEPTGVLGLRKFKNPRFTPEMEQEWVAAAEEALQKALEAGGPEKLAENYVASTKVQEYFQNPGRVEPPFLTGITCAFCHIAFDPLNPPEDPENPRWENLSANIGNQYFDEGGLFFGRGRLSGGNLRPLEESDRDPYRTQGWSPQDFLWHYGASQQRGTSETSRFSYDFINNPNTINQIFNVPNRVAFWETAPNGVTQPTLHVLKDGADSVGVPMALQRVFVNIGMESRYWIDHLFNPFSGQRQRPLVLDEIRLNVTPQREAALKALYKDDIYGEDFGLDWKFTEARMPDMIAYLSSYKPFYLKDAKGFKKEYIDSDRARRGATVFADTCAECHSSKQPSFYVTQQERKAWFRQAVNHDDFRNGNALSNGQRYPVSMLKINSQRAMATNAVDGDIWAELSSKEYKAQPPVGRLELQIPVSPTEILDIEYTPAGGGRGYYRPASLVSLWATAPFLHNNSVGKEPLKVATEADITEDRPYLVAPGDRITDYRAVTVEGRLELFRDACHQLLWPERRVPHIKRTSADARVLPPEVFKQALGHVTADIGAELILGYVKGVLVDHRVSDEAAEAIIGALRPKLIDKLIAVTDKLNDPNKLEQTTPLLENEIVTVLEGIISATGKDHQVPVRTLIAVTTQVKPLVREVIDAIDAEIPAGTPINLLLNQNIASLPYVALAMIKYKKDPGKLAEALLNISECPDIVENSGHYFGTQWDPRGTDYALDDDQKQDLIEFLKTL